MCFHTKHPVSILRLWRQIHKCLFQHEWLHGNVRKRLKTNCTKYNMHHWSSWSAHALDVIFPLTVGEYDLSNLHEICVQSSRTVAVSSAVTFIASTQINNISFFTALLLIIRLLMLISKSRWGNEYLTLCEAVKSQKGGTGTTRNGTLRSSLLPQFNCRNIYYFI